MTAHLDRVRIAGLTSRTAQLSRLTTPSLQAPALLVILGLRRAHWAAVAAAGLELTWSFRSLPVRARARLPVPIPDGFVDGSQGRTMRVPTPRWHRAITGIHDGGGHSRPKPPRWQGTTLLDQPSSMRHDGFLAALNAGQVRGDSPA